MNVAEKAKVLLVGSYVSKHSLDIIWTYQPGLSNKSFPIDLYIHQLRNDKWIIQDGDTEDVYSSFDECLKHCIDKKIEYSIKRKK